MNLRSCPICNEESTGSCKCMRCDSSCKNNHSWHKCTIHNVIVEGMSDHSTDTMSCTCGDNKTWYIDKQDESEYNESRSEGAANDQKEWNSMLTGLMGYTKSDDVDGFSVYTKGKNEVRILN